MTKKIIIALDTMSGDIGPRVTLPAALQAIKFYPTLKLLLVGKPKIIKPLLKQATIEQISRIEIVPAYYIVENNIKLSILIKDNKKTSMRVAIDLVKNGYAKACISAGDTGVLVGLSKLILKSIKGINKPALMTILPNQQKKQTVVLDLGANINCSSVMLIQFAIMGSIISEEITKTIKPKVALLNIGKEDNKGLNVIREADVILKKTPLINYIGYIEGDELLTGKTDVLVCDGFSGNILLKTMEGVIRVISSFLNSKNNKIKNYNYFKTINNFCDLNPDKYNGATILGLKSIVIKSHGSANENAFKSAINQAIHAINKRIPEKIITRLNIISNRSN